MAFTRVIRQNFFNHPLIAKKYNVQERYFLIGLACTADDFGRFWFNESNLKATIFPTDRKTIKWIKNCLDKFLADTILCHYTIDDVDYLHFPSWFEKGWFLKQKVDHPREFASPDCPMCLTEEKKRNKNAIKTRSFADNINKANPTDDNTNHVELNSREKIHKRLTDSTVRNTLMNKYQLVELRQYVSILDDYITWVERNSAFDRDHEREFEGRLMAAQEKLEDESFSSN